MYTEEDDRIEKVVDEIKSNRAFMPCKMFEPASKAIFWLCLECGWELEYHEGDDE